MRNYIVTIFFIISLSQAFGQLKPQGIFIGLENIKGHEDLTKPNYKWHYLSVLTFKGDSVFLSQSPVAIYKKDTIFSVSDSGFFFYKGTVKKYQGMTIADLKLDSCVYCPNKLLKFTPPKLLKEDGTVSTNYNDTATIYLEVNAYENSDINKKTLTIEKTKSNKNILVNKIIYRRQYKK